MKEKRVTTGIRWGKKQLCRSDRWPRGSTTCLVLKSGVAISYTQERESLFSSAGLHKDLFLLQNQLQGLHTQQSLPTHVMNDMGSRLSLLYHLPPSTGGISVITSTEVI